jgi:hypothetical protein
MSKIKTRIQGFKSTTGSQEAITACNEALARYAEYSYINLSPADNAKVENAIAESLIAALENIDESGVKSFLDIEKRIYGMNNLGVKTTLAAVKESDIAKHPSLMYTLERMANADQQPEWLVAEHVASTLSSFAWEPAIKESLATLTANCEKYAEDIKIYKAVHEAKSGRSSFIISGVEKDIDAYLNQRTSTNRSKLMESLSKHAYDPTIKALYNVVSESERSFQLRGTSNNAFTQKVYSPVIITESDEIFAVHGKAYVKSGTNMRPLVEEEYKKLPDYFTFLSSFMSQSNVEVSENKMKIFSKDKKVELIEEAEGLGIYINNKKVTINEFHNVYLNSGIFRFDEKEVITAVGKIVENWDAIFELDFVKSITPVGNPNRRADIFVLGEKTFINTVDGIMKESKFYNDCNATQSRNLILEFANFDLGLTFNTFIVNEEAQINKLNEEKAEYVLAIKHLEERKAQIENLPDLEVRESEEVKELVNSIDEEISNLKDEYYTIQNKIVALTKVSEGVGANVGDEVEFLKKKR